MAPGTAGRKALIVGGVTFDTVIRLDRFPEPRSQTVFSQGYHETLGSTGAGKALNLRKLGFDVTLHALVGEDSYGQRIEAYLRQAGVHFIRELDPRGTERHVNLMDAQGGRISFYMAYVRDTNGAGDAFFAGFLFGHAQGYPLEQCLRLATLVGGLCVTSEELAAPALSPELLDEEYRKHFG
jgi:sugar/nucleoside kinase (ribokinase family)